MLLHKDYLMNQRTMSFARTIWFLEKKFSLWGVSMMGVFLYGKSHVCEHISDFYIRVLVYLSEI